MSRPVTLVTSRTTPVQTRDGAIRGHLGDGTAVVVWDTGERRLYVAAPGGIVGWVERDCGLIGHRRENHE